MINNDIPIELHEAIMQIITDRFLEDYLSPDDFVVAYEAIRQELENDY